MVEISWGGKECHISQISSQIWHAYAHDSDYTDYAVERVFEFMTCPVL
jgi:hypothetical protein